MLDDEIAELIRLNEQAREAFPGMRLPRDPQDVLARSWGSILADHARLFMDLRIHYVASDAAGKKRMRAFVLLLVDNCLEPPVRGRKPKA